MTCSLQDSPSLSLPLSTLLSPHTSSLSLSFCLPLIPSRLSPSLHLTLSLSSHHIFLPLFLSVQCAAGFYFAAVADLSGLKSYVFLGCPLLLLMTKGGQNALIATAIRPHQCAFTRLLLCLRGILNECAGVL
jgi:hypothetical protein